MPLTVTELRADVSAHLERYATIPISFLVTSRLVTAPTPPASFDDFRTQPVAAPYLKDYDAFDAERPVRWMRHFDLSRWAMFVATEDTRLIGGAVVAWNTPGVDMLEGRADLAVLWDLRVHPEFRGRGVGYRLFAAAESWAQARACRELKIETQDINVAACRFYARQGCKLRAVHPGAYPDLPDEAQLLWYKSLQH